MEAKSDITDNLSETLKYYREKRGFTLKNLEEKTGVSASYLNRLEKGSRNCPTIEVLDLISKGLDISINCLLAIPSEVKIKSFEELLIRNDFIINEKRSELEIKQKIIELFEIIKKSNDEHEDINKNIYEILCKSNDLKELLRDY